MPAKITNEQRNAVLQLLAEGQDSDTISATVGITPGQVSAIKAHVRMGTYSLPESHVKTAADQLLHLDTIRHAPRGAIVSLPGHKENQVVIPAGAKAICDVLLGVDPETLREVHWNPDPSSGSANPHVLVLGESGFGKTYTIACLLTELAAQGVHSIVFDYGQGFTPATLPEEFVRATAPVEIHASRQGININPLQIFPADVHGPVNVAQRVADTFARVYPRIGMQQHAVLRQAVLDVMADEGIVAGAESSWTQELPEFGNIRQKLQLYASGSGHAPSRVASLAESHISTIFVFNTFRPSGKKLAWSEMLASESKVWVIQLKGLEHSLEMAVTEFLLWNLIGYYEALGPGPLKCFIVLDEAHKLAFDVGSPVEKLLREGRKYGLGLILASQQPEDFSPVAFANTATKLVFQIGDDRSVVSRQLFRKVRNADSFLKIYELITRLPRGVAYVVTNNCGRLVKITPIGERLGKMEQHQHASSRQEH